MFFSHHPIPLWPFYTVLVIILYLFSHQIYTSLVSIMLNPVQYTHWVSLSILHYAVELPVFSSSSHILISVCSNDLMCALKKIGFEHLPWVATCNKLLVAWPTSSSRLELVRVCVRCCLKNKKSLEIIFGN